MSSGRGRRFTAWGLAIQGAALCGSKTRNLQSLIADATAIEEWLAAGATFDEHGEQWRITAWQFAVQCAELYGVGTLSDLIADATAVDAWLRGGGDSVSGAAHHHVPDGLPKLDCGLVVDAALLGDDGGGKVGSRDVQPDASAEVVTASLGIIHNESPVDGFGSASTVGEAGRVGNDPAGEVNAV